MTNSGGGAFAPGWLARQIQQARISVMTNHHPEMGLRIYEMSTPVSDADAEELRAVLAARFKAWTGKDLNQPEPPHDS